MHVHYSKCLETTGRGRDILTPMGRPIHPRLLCRECSITCRDRLPAEPLPVGTRLGLHAGGPGGHGSPCSPDDGVGAGGPPSCPGGSRSSQEKPETRGGEGPARESRSAPLGGAASASPPPPPGGSSCEPGPLCADGRPARRRPGARQVEMLPAFPHWHLPLMFHLRNSGIWRKLIIEQLPLLKRKF